MAAFRPPCGASGALEVVRAANEAERERVWHVRRQLSYALRATGAYKINHDVVVPRGRVPELFDEVRAPARGVRPAAGVLRARRRRQHPRQHPDRRRQRRRSGARASLAERELFARVVALEGSISGEHGIGFTKSKHLDLELSPDVIALMKRVKAAFDPDGILNPGKIFP